MQGGIAGWSLSRHPTPIMVQYMTAAVAEQPVSQRIVHFVLHVPKCAGMTIDTHFRAALGEGFLRAPRWRNPLRVLIGERHALRPGDPRLPGLRLVTGHSLGVSLKRRFPDAEIRESVLLRDPVGFHLSLYNFRVARHAAGAGPRPPGFADWYAAQRRNPVSRFLLNHYFELRFPALYRLSSRGRLAFLESHFRGFWFVGDVRQADGLIAGIAGELGVAGQAVRRNVTHAPAVTEAELDPALRARILAGNPLDLALWERWKDRGWRAEGRNPDAPPPDLPADDARTFLREDVTIAARRLLAPVSGASAT